MFLREGHLVLLHDHFSSYLSEGPTVLTIIFSSWVIGYHILSVTLYIHFEKDSNQGLYDFVGQTMLKNDNKVDCEDSSFMVIHPDGRISVTELLNSWLKDEFLKIMC